MQEQQRPAVTRSEPGVANSDHDRFAAYVNRFATLEKQRKEVDASTTSRGNPPHSSQQHPQLQKRRSGNLSQPQQSVDSGRVPDRVRKYNDRYPEPTPRMVPSDEEKQLQHQSLSSHSYSGSGGKETNYRESSGSEERRASSPLVPTEEELYQHQLQQQLQARKSSRSEYKTGSSVKHNPHDQPRSERPIMRHAPPQRRTSMPPNRSQELEPEYPARSSKSQATTTTTDVERFSKSVPDFGETVEKPSRTSVQELKRQLWDHDERSL